VYAILIFLMFLTLVALFILFQATCLVITTFVRYPHSIAMWISFGIVLLFASMSIAGPYLHLALLWQQIAWGGLGISLIALVLTAWVVKTYNTELSHPEKESLVTRVTRRSWWPKNEQLADEKELAKAA
jgi:hypothetical protein